METEQSTVLDDIIFSIHDMLQNLDLGWFLQQKDGLGNAIKVTDFLSALPSLANWAGLYLFAQLTHSSTVLEELLLLLYSALLRIYVFIPVFNDS